MIENLKIEFNHNVFKPTGTSELLISSIKKNLKLEGDVLDLGAGSGYIGLKLLRLFEGRFNLYASDVDAKSVKFIKKNAQLNKLKVNAKTGSLLKVWKKKKFNFIINDISGISEDVAKISPWFKNVSCKSGKDGTKLTIKVIKDSKSFLKNKGILCFPVISFANEKKIVNFTKKKFKRLKMIGLNEWPLPKEMINKISLLEKLKKKGYINYKNNFGMIIWYTKIFIAYN
tara:strand:- start:1182 stop:1868 length:687 start_codon:yes stop_codon:yes gene_type:complete